MRRLEVMRVLLERGANVSAEEARQNPVLVGDGII
jgi:hypothetical protein